VTTFRVFDNATTNAGTVLFASTLAAGVSKTFMLPIPLKALNGVTINASAAGAAGAVYRYGGGPRSFFVRSISGATAANVVASATPVVLYGFTVNPAGAGAHTITLFDNATTSTGTVLFSETTTTAANDSPLVFNFPVPLKVTNGVTATIATTAVGDISVWVG
jgi:dolichol kinase